MMAGTAVCLSSCGGGTKSSGIDPIEWYRDISGDSRNDLNDKAAANSKNLEQGSKVPFPNLASVPKEPDNAVTKADRDKMAQSLIADRVNAQYTDEQLRAGQNMQAVTPPPPEVSMTPSPNAATAPATAAGTPPPNAAAAPGQAVTQERPSTAPAPKGRQTAIPSAPAPATGKTADAARPPAQARKQADARKKPVRRGSEQPPDESSLRPPAIGAMPEGAQAQEPPPRPVVGAARPSHSEEVAAAAPYRGDLEPGKSRRSVGQAIDIKLAPAASRDRIPEAQRNRLVEVARLVAENDNARVRIVGYSGASSQGDKAQRDYESFNAALNNAKAVGIELARLGVPPGRIDVETKASAGSADRAEIFVEH